MAENNNQNQAPQTQEELSSLLQIRRQKLTDLQAAGKDPFVITKFDVTNHSVDVKDNFEEYENKEVVLAVPF